MIDHIHDPIIEQTLQRARQAAGRGATRPVTLDGRSVDVPYPFPSPRDWRDCPIYFLMLDRFNNPTAPPAGPWNQRYDFRQGGTFNGVRQQLDYIAGLGMRAIWLTPVLKAPQPDWRWNYHGYGTQHFLAIDERLGSDGTRPTAEAELRALVMEAHARGLYVILDIVLNHAARVFDYVVDGEPVADLADPGVLHAHFGQEPPVRWLNGFGFPRADWQDRLPPPEQLSVDDAVWPSDLQRIEFFRRRGSKLTDDPGDDFVRGDFDVMRQLVVEYDATVAGQEELRGRYGQRPVLSILVRAYQYLVAAYDFDGFRIDTVKYVDPDAIQTFGNAMREYALSIGKHNFFTFGEIYDDEETIAAFVGRNGSNREGFGIDAALDFPLFFGLQGAVKGRIGVEALRRIFERRKAVEHELLSSHGEAGRFFVTFLDNHDQTSRFNHPETPQAQVSQALALLFTLQGIPSLYYGTEQGLQGTVTAAGQPHLGNLESVREALWGKGPKPFDQIHPLYQKIQRLAALRASEPALRYGRLYWRQLSGNQRDFGHPRGVGGVLAFSRILSAREIVIVANTHTEQSFSGLVLVDRDLFRDGRAMIRRYSNLAPDIAGPDATGPTAAVRTVAEARFWEGDRLIGRATASALPLSLAPMEVQIWAPVD